ncbi:Crp/Fnr family transcriptional regulator [Aquimarina algiphila]|uniref:Crp/Fnr family transcriptional regulator n=1 Tax=Aquimarina algiphila TaxID=2047982 RepID=UPI00248FE34A|nr:Crp/Fnr family transcriptional regulator [Aquimarina algiphila]
MKNQLYKYLNRYAKFDNVDIELIYKNGVIQTYDNKEFLLEQNSVCKYKYFISKGLVRQYKVEDSGNENISAFAIENWWITNLDSFINETNSLNAIQALEETTVLQITKENLEHLYSKIPKLERAFRIISENMLIAFQRKNELHMNKNSEKRYYNFVEKLPNFSQRVPQYMIASYLNITPEYLSEIRKK